MKDFWNFKKMITPIIIPILFGIGVFLCIVVGLFYTLGGIFGTPGPFSFLGVQWNESEPSSVFHVGTRTSTTLTF